MDRAESPKTKSSIYYNVILFNYVPLSMRACLSTQFFSSLIEASAELTRQRFWGVIHFTSEVFVKAKPWTGVGNKIQNISFLLRFLFCRSGEVVLPIALGHLTHNIPMHTHQMLINVLHLLCQWSRSIFLAPHIPADALHASKWIDIFWCLNILASDYCKPHS